MEGQGYLVSGFRPILDPGPVGAVCNRPIGVNFRKNNCLGPRPGRFGFAVYSPKCDLHS